MNWVFLWNLRNTIILSFYSCRSEVNLSFKVIDVDLGHPRPLDQVIFPLDLVAVQDLIHYCWLILLTLHNLTWIRGRIFNFLLWLGNRGFWSARELLRGFYYLSIGISIAIGSLQHRIFAKYFIIEIRSVLSIRLKLWKFTITFFFFRFWVTDWILRFLAGFGSP